MWAPGQRGLNYDPEPLAWSEAMPLNNVGRVGEGGIEAGKRTIG